MKTPVAFGIGLVVGLSGLAANVAWSQKRTGDPPPKIEKWAGAQFEYKTGVRFHLELVPKEGESQGAFLARAASDVEGEKNSTELFIGELNSEGRYGWEVVSVYPITPPSPVSGMSISRYEVLMKRRKL